MTNDRFALARAEAERLVRSGGLTYERVGKLVGVHASTVRLWKEKYDWPRGPVEMVVPAQSAADQAAAAGRPASDMQSKRRKNRRKRGPVDRAGLIKRLYAAIESNLQALEQRMNDDTTPSAADGERDARALATAIRNLEKVTELEAGTERDADTAARKRGGTPTADDEHRLRLEIAERILRIQEQQRKLQP